jgi:hypothetical protein
VQGMTGLSKLGDLLIRVESHAWPGEMIVTAPMHGI